jgi:hypothetical protein
LEHFSIKANQDQKLQKHTMKIKLGHMLSINHSLPLSCPWRILAAALLLLAGDPGRATTTNFNAAGTYSWTPPAGVTTVTVECWGGGGAGGSVTNAGNGTAGTSAAGGGGAGGAYAIKTNLTVSPGTTYTITVGSGGTPPALSPADNARGDGSFSGFNFNSTTYVLAMGGNGGNSKNAVRPAQGNGGSCQTGSIGDTINLGGGGANANGTNQVAGGGGGSGGDSFAGANGGSPNVYSSGAGGTVGGGAGGAGAHGNSAPGNAGNSPGGGGGGGIASAVNANQLGGIGAPGKVAIIYVPTYTWIPTAGSNDWNAAANWTPNRTSPATNDILLFSQGGSSTATNVPTQTIGKFQVSGTTTVTLQPASGLNTLTIGGAAIDALIVAGGAQLNFSGATSLTNLNLNVATGAKASISGSMMLFNNSAANDNFTLTAADGGGITFNAGALFTQNCNGSVFGSGSANSVIFASGSTFIQKIGTNPFQKSAPASVVVFQAGSLFSIQGNPATSFSGRAYADLEINSASFNQSVNGASPLTISNLNVLKGTLNLGLNQFNQKGNVTVTANATLNISGTNFFNGAAEQIISGGGAFGFGPGAAITIANGSTLTLNLQTNLVLGGGILFTNNGTFNIESMLAGTGDICGNGSTIVSSAGTLAPGTTSTIGTLTFAAAPVLNGTNLLKIDRNGGSPLADKILLSSGPLNYGGTLVVTNIGAPLQPGDTFTNFSAATFTGEFSNLQLPAGYAWNTSQLSVNGTISVALPTISNLVVAGTNIMLNAASGTPHNPVTVLSSTNLTLPIAQWKTNVTGNFDDSGSFNYTNAGGFNPGTPQQFYLLKTQ